MPPTKQTRYEAELSTLAPDEWEPYLRAHSGLPGPRGNLELAYAVAATAGPAQVETLLQWTPDRAPTNTPGEFLAFCGTLALGAQLAAGERSVLPRLAAAAADPRWRVREAAAAALQLWGDVDMDALLREMTRWSQGDGWVQRAAVAALCEPRLLRHPAQAEQVLALLDAVTAGFADRADRRSDAQRTLRQALGYGWSVAIVAAPEPGKRRFAHWCNQEDPDIRWIVRENLKKARLARMDPAWVAAAHAQLSRGSA